MKLSYQNAATVVSKTRNNIAHKEKYVLPRVTSLVLLSWNTFSVHICINMK
jgi:hypothetical protein